MAHRPLGLPRRPAARGVTLVNTVPSALAELVREGTLPPGVLAVNLAGEALPGSLVRRIYERSAARRVVNLYGPSEDTTYSTWTTVAAADLESASGPLAPSIGRPLSGTRSHLLDPPRWAGPPRGARGPGPWGAQ